jgi:hypothetical protein
MTSSMESALCTIRVQPQQHHLIFTVTCVRFPAHGFRPNRTGPSMSCADFDEALAAVRNFLDSYTADSRNTANELE